jgi:hypothetical protein
MLLTLVDHETFDYQDPTHSIMCEMSSDHVPAVGDLIKDGHRLSSFTVYRVEGRVYRSRPVKNGENADFTRVYLVVSTQASH